MSNTASTFAPLDATQTQDKESQFQRKHMGVFEVLKSYTVVLSLFLAMAKLRVIHYTV